MIKKLLKKLWVKNLVENKNQCNFALAKGGIAQLVRASDS